MREARIVYMGVSGNPSAEVYAVSGTNGRPLVVGDTLTEDDGAIVAHVSYVNDGRAAPCGATIRLSIP